MFLPVALCIGAALLLAGPTVLFVSRRGGLHLRARR